jgi:LysR family nitrogen assimilation transcriptional regulator
MAAPSTVRAEGAARKDNQMEFRQLRYFICIAEVQSMTKAADALFIAQPALSMQMRNLEEELGVQLLVRHSRGVHLTEAGAIFYDKAVRIVRDIDAAKMTANLQATTRDKPVRLGINPSIDADLIATILTMARENPSSLQVTVLEGSSDQLIQWISEDVLDIAIVYFVPEGIGGIMLDPLFTEDLVLVSNIGDALSESISFDKISEIPLILQPVSHKLRSMVDEAAAEGGYELRVPFEVRSVHIIVDLVERGLGASILPASAVRRSARDGRVHVRSIIHPSLTLQLSLACAEFKRQSGSEILLRRLIRQIVRP